MIVAFLHKSYGTLLKNQIGLINN